MIKTNDFNGDIVLSQEPSNYSGRESDRGKMTSLEGGGPPKDLLHDWSNNNLNLNLSLLPLKRNSEREILPKFPDKADQSARDSQAPIIRNGNDCGEEEGESALESARSMTLDRKDGETRKDKASAEDSSEFLFDDLGAESDQESHTSSLESAPGDGTDGGLRKEGFCSEEELGSSTSCSLDSFEITSPFNTLSLEKKGQRDETGEEETPKVESRGSHRFQESNGCSSANGRADEALSSFSSSQDGLTHSTGINCRENIVPPAPLTDKAPNPDITVVIPSSSKQSECEWRRKEDLCLDESKKRSIHEELSQLDTGMPDLDFSKLEERLNTAARERENSHRKMMFEEVRRRLAMDPEEASSSYAYPPMPSTRPAKSNLAKRLQSGKSLQVCYMNDGMLSDDDEEEETSDSCSGTETEDDLALFSVPKSKSTPNLSGRKGIGGVGRSASSLADSSKKASELRQAAQLRDAQEISNQSDRQAKLEAETRLMLAKAKQAARMQMEVERQTKTSKTYIEEIVGIPLSKRRLTRPQLMKMGITQLQLIVNDLLTKIESLNEELVHYLVDRDNLHMEQDSMLVDVEDLLQHQSSENLPGFLVQAPHESKPSKFRIFKR